MLCVEGGGAALPDHLRDPDVDSEQHRRNLKTYLLAGHSMFSALEVYVIALYESTLTYLLSAAYLMKLQLASYLHYKDSSVVGYIPCKD